MAGGFGLLITYCGCCLQPACSCKKSLVCGAQCHETVINFVSATAPAGPPVTPVYAHRVYVPPGRDGLSRSPDFPARELPEASMQNYDYHIYPSLACS